MTLEIDDAVEVVALTNTPQQQIAAFLDRKRPGSLFNHLQLSEIS
jgi:hypothetical protein